MAVVREFLLPDLGEGLTEAEIVRWLVQVGDHVEVDQHVVEVETAKALVEVPCPYAGVVTARFGEEGAEVPVGSALITVAVGSPEDASGEGAAAGGAVNGSAGEDGGSGNVLVGYGTSAGGGRRRRVRQAAPVAAAGAVGSGPVPVISPLVRRLAREHGVDLRSLSGSGPEGLILRADVERAAGLAPRGEAAAAPAPQEAASAGDGGVRVPLRGVQRVAAERVARSRREIPDATCWVDVDATELLAARAAMNASGGERVSLLALLARITTAGLRRFPQLNAVVDGSGHEVVHLPSVHLGFAAQTERGLVVPVVRDADRMSVAELSVEMGRLTEAARAGTLGPGEVTGSTFTLNNYGVFGVDGSTPIINFPEAGMLGVGRIVAKPWVVDGELAVRSVGQLSFTFDHRVCDGGVAGGFLRFVGDCVESPMRLLREL